METDQVILVAKTQTNDDQSIDLEIEGRENVSHSEHNVPELHRVEPEVFNEYSMAHCPITVQGLLQETLFLVLQDLL